MSLLTNWFPARTPHSLPHPLTECKREMMDFVIMALYVFAAVSTCATILIALRLFKSHAVVSTKVMTEEEQLRVTCTPMYAISLFDTEELALLPCGASLRRLHDGFALSVLRDRGPFAPYGNTLRDGDSVLFCPRKCANALGCPLLEKYFKTAGAEELESFAQGLAREFKAVDGDGDLPHVGDDYGHGNPCKTVPIRLKGACISHRDGDFHFVISPMAKVVHEGNQGGCGSEHAGDHGDSIAPSGKESDDNIFHAGNAITPTEATQA